MTKIVGHIVGMDEIHKRKFIHSLEKINPSIRVIDLDRLQQLIYNHKDTIKQKLIWSQVSKDVITFQNQKKLLGSKKVSHKNIDTKIKEFMQKRNDIKRNIHDIWKDMMKKHINSEIESNPNAHILFVGFNIFPKDFRIKVNLDMSNIPANSKNPNKIIINIKSDMYAMNQIKYYLTAHHNKIIKGVFPINLLKSSYVGEKYEKVTNYYHNHDYQLIDQEKLLDIISKLVEQITVQDRIKNQTFFIATLFKSEDLIPIGQNKSMEVFLTKDEAVNAVKSKIKKNRPIFVYQIDSSSVVFLENKYYLNSGVQPINEESILLTI
jgi:hypothetical protein